MRRRTFLKVTVVGATALALGALVSRLLTPPTPARARADAELVLRAVIPALLDGVLPLEAAAAESACRQALQRTLQAIDGLAPATRAELDDLFSLLASRPGRWLAGVDWDAAGPAEAARFLQRWRTSSFSLFVAAYQALHDLVLGPWYGDPATWDAIGYPGPMRL
ncbi:MAG: hypothetical protein NZL99_06080 [Burkholderiaceae bacterium]|nr:hypothetical protein [Burkholderiaceae bacterium]